MLQEYLSMPREVILLQRRRGQGRFRVQQA